MKLMATAAGDSVDVILRDGGTLRLRPPERDDAPALLDFYRALSTQSLHRRFHGLPNLRPQLVESLLEPDWAERGALLGALSDEDGERIVAIGNYVRLRDPALAESAFAVADSEQGEGSALGCWSAWPPGQRRSGSSASSPRSWPTTGRCSASSSAQASSSSASWPTASSRSSSRSRRRSASRRASRSATTRPSSRRCVRSSNRGRSRLSAPRRDGERSAASSSATSLEADFAGAAYPVNPKGAAVAGVRGYASVAEIPDPVDLAVISVPGEHVLAAAEDALRSGVRALVVISAGFAEVGQRRCRARKSALLALVRSHGARLIGPNCLGIAVAGPRLNATFAARARRRVATSASPPSAARSASPCSRRPTRAGSASRRSSRSGTRRTSPRTTCSSGGRTTRRPTSSCSTSSRSATRAASGGLRAASHAASRFWR